jgi:histone-lysine N-methyltransferase SETMAR
LDEDDILCQKQMTEMLNVAQQRISDHLKAMGNIQKCGKWVPHELNERQMENRKNTCEILLQRHEIK